MRDTLRDDAPIQTDSDRDGGVPPSPSGGPGAEDSKVAPSRYSPRILSILWIPVSIVALFLLVRDPGWREAPDWMSRLRAVRIEQWVGVLLLAIHAWFLGSIRR